MIATGVTDIGVIASGKHTVATTADGSNKTDNSGTAVGVAVAIQVVDSNSAASIGGTASLTAAHVNVTGEMPTSTFDAKATAGASGSGISVAGALAINVATLDANALVSSGPVDVHGADVALTASSTLTNTAEALGKSETSGNVGVGAAVALNIVNDTTVAAIADGANLCRHMILACLRPRSIPSLRLRRRVLPAAPRFRRVSRSRLPISIPRHLSELAAR